MEQNNERRAPEIFMDAAEGPYVIADISYNGAAAFVENSLPKGWAVGNAWWNGTGTQLEDGRWKLPLTKVVDHERERRDRLRCAE